MENTLSKLLRESKNFAQSASNSVASNVSAPVDGLAWLLKKAGVPMPTNPMGGSDWMAEKGLTRPVNQNSLSGLLGEFAGLAGPMVAAGKAPQIAKGLLSLDDKAMDMGRVAIENRMVKSGMIQPATVWHGSPHKFDAFDSAKIGTGEGAQAYGHGLYLADSPDVATSYQKMLTNFKPPKELQTFQSRLDTAKANGNLDQISHFQNLVNNYPKNQGALYKVDLPDEHIAKMLDWDSPLSKQSAEVQAAVRKIRPGIDNLGSPDWNGKMVKAMDESGEDFISWMGRGHSDRLKEQGIPGIRYLDGGSRATGGTSNYVVFPGNEGLLNIMERNGQKLR